MRSSNIFSLPVFNIIIRPFISVHLLYSLILFYLDFQTDRRAARDLVLLYIVIKDRALVIRKGHEGKRVGKGKV